jgi:hypothetical protein
MKKEKRVRAQNSGGKGNNQTQNHARNPGAKRIFRFYLPARMLPLIEKAEAFMGESRNEFIIQAIRAKVMAIKDDMEEGRPVNPAPSTALVELGKVCRETYDLLYMMALPVLAVMGETGPFGDGIQDIAANMARRLSACLHAVTEENRQKGGTR